MRRISKLAGIIFPAFLVLIGIFLAWKNYAPGSFLIGWDSLHPEFNFSLAFQRAIFGVWRGEQGVGAIAAHSHMADLPRILFLWLSSIVLPVSFLRYFYIFLCLILGPLGVYFFLKYVLRKENSIFRVLLASFLGGVFYLLNLVTLQHFYVPFEMFQTLYAFLPWLFLFALKFLKDGRKNRLLVFAFLSILSSPMAYAATLFYSYFAVLALFIISYSIFSGKILVTLKRGTAILFVILALNSYWILPNIYSIVRQSPVIENAKINRLFTPEAFLRNQEYGDFQDVLIGKSFLFDWRAFDFSKGTFVDLLGGWSNHLANPQVVDIGYCSAILAIFGLAVSLMARNKVGLAFVVPLGLSLFFLINNNPPTGIIYNYIYQNIAIFKEAMRMPFTKFSIPFIFFFSFYLAYFFNFLFVKFPGRFGTVLFSLVATGGILAGLIYLMAPAFGGNLIYPSLERKIPEEYFQSFDWFKGQKEGRIAELPAYTLWGWSYRNWGYEGSGFLSFGITDPILDRDFDRWSAGNENFYNEISSAIYSQDALKFKNVLEKYQVRYLLLDESVVNTGGSQNLLFIPEIKSLLASSDIKSAAQFGFLTIYDTRFGQDEIGAPKKLFQEPKTIDIPGALAQSQLLFSEDFRQNRGFSEAYNCDLKKVGQAQKENLGDKIVYEAEGSGVSCDFFDYPILKYSEGYILRVSGQNVAGRSLKIYLQNKKTRKMDVEELLPEGNFDAYYLVPPKNIEGEGYTLNLETRSFGRINSENILVGIEIYSLPQTLSSSLLSDIDNPSYLDNKLDILKVNKIGPEFYTVDYQGDGLLSLNQGYEDGWIAFSMANDQWQMTNKLKHVKVDSWANGWLVPNQPINQSTIILFYWPQLLEYLGFVLLVGTLIAIFSQGQT